MTLDPSVVYVAPDKMGGMMTVIANLLEYRRPDAFAYRAVLTHNRLDGDMRYARPLAADSQTTVEYMLPPENLHAVLRRLARAVGTAPGVIVAGDLLDLAMLSVHDIRKAVILILHGDYDYYYDLAVKHDVVVDAYVAASRRMYERLVECLPHRADAIFYLPYGIPLPRRVRQRHPGPLRLIFAGRVHGQKGVLDLPGIDASLRARGVDVTWTVAGGGPDEGRLRELWAEAESSVRFVGALTNRETIERLADHDVFVLPTRAEGFPVALLEAMGAGLVPVVSDIASGVPEVVTDGLQGFRRPIGDIEGFAAAIAALAADRERLEIMSGAARQTIEHRFDIRDQVGAYQALYARYGELRRVRPAGAMLHYGSRLDRPWLPNAVVRLIRSAVRRYRQSMEAAR